MKLEEGMYVRTKQGTIEKVIKRYDTPSGCKVEVNEDFRFKHYEHNYIKHIKNASHNIIDLIEVGDYVNGYKIEEVNNNLNEHKGICNCLDTYLWCVNELDKFEEIEIFENDIKSVVTKEQFSSMKYEIKEN